jgi:hypothetical protein
VPTETTDDLQTASSSEESVPLLAQQTPADPGTSLAGTPASSLEASLSDLPLDFVPQCPAGTAFSSAEGTCVSSTDAFAGSTGAHDTPEISTVTLDVSDGDKAPLGLVAAARQPPIDPGNEQTVVLGPDGVAVGSGVTGSNSAGDAGAVTRSVVEVYDGPVSQVSRTLTMIGNTKIKVCVCVCVCVCVHRWPWVW